MIFWLGTVYLCCTRALCWTALNLRRDKITATVCPAGDTVVLGTDGSHARGALSSCAYLLSRQLAFADSCLSASLHLCAFPACDRFRAWWVAPSAVASLQGSRCAVSRCELIECQAILALHRGHSTNRDPVVCTDIGVVCLALRFATGLGGAFLFMRFSEA